MQDKNEHKFESNLNWVVSCKKTLVRDWSLKQCLKYSIYIYHGYDGNFTTFILKNKEHFGVRGSETTRSLLCLDQKQDWNNPEPDISTATWLKIQTKIKQQTWKQKIIINDIDNMKRRDNQRYIRPLMWKMCFLKY